MAPYTRSNKIKGWQAILDAIKQNAKQHITTETILEQIKSLSGMGDAAVESFELTLQCPVSRMRIHVPGRGVRCKHLQCFDLATYLRMRDTSYMSSSSNVTLQTTPPWRCPICGLDLERRSSDLRIDGYFAVLLEAYTEDTVKVNVLSDGSHHPVAEQDEFPEETVIGSESPSPITQDETKPLGRACNAKRVKVERLEDCNFDQIGSLSLSSDALPTEPEADSELPVNAAQTTRNNQQASTSPAFRVGSHTFVKTEPQVQTNAGRLTGMGPAETSTNKTASAHSDIARSGYAEKRHVSANCQLDKASSDRFQCAHEESSRSSSKRTAPTAAPASTSLTIPVKRKRTPFNPDAFVSLRGDEQKQSSLSCLSIAHMTNTSTNVGCIVSQMSVASGPVHQRGHRQSRFERRLHFPTHTYRQTLCSTLPVITDTTMRTEDIFSSELVMHTERLKNLGNLHYSRKEYETAVDFYTKSLEIHSSVVALASRAQARLAMGNYGHAYVDSNEAILVEPNNAGCMFRRALALLGMSLWHQAARDLGRCKNKGIEPGLLGAAFAYVPSNYAANPSLVDIKMASELARAAAHECPERSLGLLTLSISLNQTQDVLSQRAYCHLKLGRLEHAFVDASEALAMGSGCEELKDIVRLLREKMVYPYYERASWPKHFDIHSIVFKSHCTRYGASLTTVSCFDVNGTEIQPSINRNNVQQFLTFHASRPKKMVFETLDVDEACLESLRFVRKMAYSDDVTFTGCKFVNQKIFDTLFGEINFPRKIRFERCQLPEEVTLNALFSLPPLRKADLLSLDFELSPKDAPLHKLLLLKHLASGFPALRIPAAIISGDFADFFNDLVDVFLASRRKQPYGLAIQLRHLPESVAKVPTLVNKKTEETLSWHVTPLAGSQPGGRQLTMFIVRSSRRHAEKDILRKLEYDGQ